MPDTLIWTGDTSGDVNVAANYTPAQVPIDGDSVIVDGRSTQNMTDSLHTFAAMKFPLFFVGPDATIDIGKSTALVDSLRFAATKIVHQGSGTFYYYQPDPGTNQTNNILVNSPNRELALNMAAAGTTFLDSFVITSGRVMNSGQVVINADVYGSFRSAVASDALAVLGATLITSFYMGGGTISVLFLGADVYCYSGELTVEDGVGSGSASIYIGGSASVIYKNSRPVALVELRSGTLDLTQRSRELTITTLRRWPNTTLKTNELVTIDTTEDMTGGDI